MALSDSANADIATEFSTNLIRYEEEVVEDSTKLLKGLLLAS